MERLRRNRLSIFVFSAFVFVAVLFAQNRLTQGPYGRIFRLATAGDTTALTTTQMAGLLSGTPTAAANYTTPTAAQFCSALPQVAQLSGGTNNNFALDSFIRNTSAGAFTITVVAGAGVTLTGTMTIAQNTIRHFLIVPTACPNPATGLPVAAVTIFSVSGAGTF